MGNIGDHIRKRRLERGLCQKGTATQIGVSEDTLRDWELGRQHPRANNIPEIIEFLGYDPGLPRQNVAETIARERKRCGLNVAQMAAQVGVSDDTLRNWEAGKYLPTRTGYEQLAAFLARC
jgi:DNA-binding transcriptional regulator YiaG